VALSTDVDWLRTRASREAMQVADFTGALSVTWRYFGFHGVLA
jgi:hypothetical protein